MSFMNFSGAVRPGYQTLRTSTIFVGDSITWGYGLDQNQTIAYGVQNRINTVLGYSSVTWGNSSTGLDICARNVIVDDTTLSPFNGGAPPAPFANPLLSPTSVLTAGLGTYPFSDTTNNSSGSNVSTAYPSTSNVPDAITLVSGAKITWNATYATSNGYVLVGLMGAGTVQVKQGSTVLQTLTSGGIFNATVNSGSATMTLTSIVSGSLIVGAPLSGTGVPTSPVTTIVSYTGTSIGDTITMSATASASSTNTGYLALAPTMSATGGLNVVGPFSGASGTNTYSIENNSGNGAVVVGVLHPVSLFPTLYNEVQINGRNSYAISDFSSPSGDTIQKQILATATQSTAFPSTASNPIYILSVGTVSLYDTARQLTPSQYQTQLSTLATALKNSSYVNYGRVVLTVPPVPTGAFSLLAPYTLNDYRFKIIELARTLGCGYVDLSQVKMSSSDYLSDGLHPSAVGAAKLARKYISMMEF
jgi:lysophospholipase L1-like esterase